MNTQLQQFARDTLKRGLAECSSDQQMLFKRMYANGHLDMPIDKVVDKMPVERLDWAMQQVQGTIVKNETRDQTFDPDSKKTS